MEYQYSDIEAQIRRAQEMRAQAVSQILLARWHAIASWFSNLAKHRLHKNIVAARLAAASIY